MVSSSVKALQYRDITTREDWAGEIIRELIVLRTWLLFCICDTLNSLKLIYGLEIVAPLEDYIYKKIYSPKLDLVWCVWFRYRTERLIRERNWIICEYRIQPPLLRYFGPNNWYQSYLIDIQIRSGEWDQNQT